MTLPSFSRLDWSASEQNQIIQEANWREVGRDVQETPRVPKRVLLITDEIIDWDQEGLDRVLLQKDCRGEPEDRWEPHLYIIG